MSDAPKLKWEHKRTIRATSIAAFRAATAQCKPLAEALAELINRGSFHGSWLPLRTASADNVAKAETAIAKAAAAGLITRGDYDPSTEQLFFGIGGFPGDRLKRLPEMHRSVLAHHWITVTTKYLDAADVEAIL